MPRLKLLGGALLDTSDLSGAGPLTRRHPLALLALLATEPSRALAREKIVGLLWPEFPEARARARLNTCVYHVRRLLGGGVLESAGDELRLRDDGLRCDVWAFRDALEAGEPRDAVRHYGGPFLDGFHLRGSAPFEKWLDREQDRLRAAYRRALETLAEAAEDRNDAGEAARWWRERFQDDPVDGRTAVRLMEALAVRGRRAAALAVGRHHVRVLREELRVEPDRRVLAWLDRVRRPETNGAGGPDRESGRPLRSSVAVLPFENTSGSDQADTFALGLHGDLLTDLSRSPSLLVISRTSVLPYRDTPRPVPEIASELGVRYVVEGEVQQAGRRMRLRVQLIDAERDTHIWAERWDRELTAETLFELQSELAEEIAGRLQAELAPGRDRQGEQPPTSDLEAYRLYVTGRTYLDQRTMSAMERAADLFREAIRRDAAYPAAWAGLAEALVHLVSYQHVPADPAQAEAERAARRSVELDPRLPEGRSALGLSHYLHRRGPEALRELYRAVELRPGDAHALTSLAVVLGPLGFWEEGIVHMEHASRLDPSSPEVRYCLGESFMLPGYSIDDCLREARRAQELSPGYAVAYLLEGRLLAESGRPEEALEPMRRSLELATERTRPRHLFPLARTLVLAGRDDDAREILDRLPDPGGTFFRGATLAVLGEVESAFDHLRRADWTPLHSVHLRYDPALRRLREEPAFADLLREVNRSWGLAPDGSLPAPGSPGG
jgi:TolB-like protein/Flp pilus assembly protein TadD